MLLNIRRIIYRFLIVLWISMPLLVFASESQERVATAKIVVPDYIEGTERVSAETFIELISSDLDTIIIDSRLSDDRLQGYIETSVSLPNTDTNCDSLAKVLPDKDTPSIFYCNGVKCGRSAKAIRIALECGYTNLYWFRGGIEEWKQKEYPLNL